MQSIPRLAGCALLMVFTLASLPVRAASFADLVHRVPSDANAIVLIDAEALFATPIAQREGWKKKQKASFSERPLSVPIESTKVLRAGRVDFQARQTQWEIAIMDVPRMPTIDEIAQRERGYVDRVANRPVAWSPRGAYVTTVSENVLGLSFPPNRQFLARWIKEPSGKIAPYLLKASQSMASTDSQLMMAIDLEDAIEPARAAAWLKKLDFLKTSGVKPDDAARLLAELRGVKFEVIFKEKAWGRLQLEFGADPAAVVPIAPKLVAAALRQLGTALDEIEGWKVSQKGDVISLNGELSDSGLLRLGSVFELPSLDLESEQSADVDKPTLYATQTHFKSVNKLLDDLLAKKHDAQTMGQLAGWAEQYAKRIDRLPLVNVDKDMQDYSAGVAEDLRQIASSLKGAGIRAGVRNSTNFDSDYGYGSYDGYYGNRTASSERSAVRKQERGQSAMTSGQIADQIRGDTSRIRRQMSERYKAEF